MQFSTATSFLRLTMCLSGIATVVGGLRSDASVKNDQEARALALGPPGDATDICFQEPAGNKRAICISYFQAANEIAKSNSLKVWDEKYPGEEPFFLGLYTLDSCNIYIIHPDFVEDGSTIVNDDCPALQDGYTLVKAATAVMSGDLDCSGGDGSDGTGELFLCVVSLDGKGNKFTADGDVGPYYAAVTGYGFNLTNIHIEAANGNDAEYGIAVADFLPSPLPIFLDGVTVTGAGYAGFKTQGDSPVTLTGAPSTFCMCDKSEGDFNVGVAYTVNTQAICDEAEGDGSDITGIVCGSPCPACPA